MGVYDEAFAAALKTVPTVDRRCVIAKITPEGLSELLAGNVECLNFPKDGRIDKMVYDLASDTLMVRIHSEQFPVVPQFERFPDFELKVNVLVSADNHDTSHAKVN